MAKERGERGEERGRERRIEGEGRGERGQRREWAKEREGVERDKVARLLTFLRCRTLDLSGKRDWIYGRVFPLPS